LKFSGLNNKVKKKNSLLRVSKEQSFCNNCIHKSFTMGHYFGALVRLVWLSDLVNYAGWDFGLWYCRFNLSGLVKG